MASPALTGLSFPTVVDLSSGAEQVTFSLSASDPAGLGDSVIFFTNPIVLVNPDGSTTAVSGINVSGTTPTTVTVSPLTPIETDTVSDLALIDAVGNRSDYTSSQLAALNLPSAITFTGGSTYTAPPALSGLSFPAVVDLSSGAEQVTFSLSASDPAGLGDSVIFFTNPIVLVNPHGSPTAVSGINVSGTTPTTVTVSPLTPIETDTVSDLALIDAVGNRSDYTSSQLAALNLPSAITFTGGIRIQPLPPSAGFHFPRSLTLAAGQNRSRFPYRLPIRPAWVTRLFSSPIQLFW